MLTWFHTILKNEVISICHYLYSSASRFLHSSCSNTRQIIFALEQSQVLSPDLSSNWFCQRLARFNWERSSGKTWEQLLQGIYLFDSLIPWFLWQLWPTSRLVPSQYHELLKVDNPIHFASAIVSHYSEYLSRYQRLIHRLPLPRPLTWWIMHVYLTDIWSHWVDPRLMRTSASWTSIAPYSAGWQALDATPWRRDCCSPSCSTPSAAGIQLGTVYTPGRESTEIWCSSRHLANYNCLLQNSLNLGWLEQKTYFVFDSGPFLPSARMKWRIWRLGNCWHMNFYYMTSFGFLRFGRIDHCWHVAWSLHSIGQLPR